MDITLVLIHTVKPLIAVFDRLVPAIIPDVKPFHILDEPLLESVRQRGALANDDVQRLGCHIRQAEQIGASAVLLTCSTVSPGVDEVRRQAAIPVVKIDEAMIARAVESGERIGVIATNVTTVAPTRRMLETQAQAVGKHITIESRMVEHALPALLAGNVEQHDKLVSVAVQELSQNVDVILLAQASTARVLDFIPAAARTIPILTSPHLALEQVREVLKQKERQDIIHHTKQ